MRERGARVSRSGRNLSHGPTHLPKMVAAAKPIQRQPYWRSPKPFLRLSPPPNCRGPHRAQVPEASWISTGCVSTASSRESNSVFLKLNFVSVTAIRKLTQCTINKVKGYRKLQVPSLGVFLSLLKHRNHVVIFYM